MFGNGFVVNKTCENCKKSMYLELSSNKRFCSSCDSLQKPCRICGKNKTVHSFAKDDICSDCEASIAKTVNEQAEVAKRVKARLQESQP